jgi:hypothetical protein
VVGIITGLIIVSSYSKTAAFTLECDYRTGFWSISVKMTYFCNVTNAAEINQERVEIDEATGNHQRTKSNGNVVKFYSDGIKWKTFPHSKKKNYNQNRKLVVIIILQPK